MVTLTTRPSADETTARASRVPTDKRPSPAAFSLGSVLLMIDPDAPVAETDVSWKATAFSGASAAEQVGQAR
jgi:hypothetical protein